MRLTGGEPTVRRDFIEIAARISAISGIRKIATTTNGYNLARNAKAYRLSGISHINVSVDSLSPERFHAITGHDKLPDVLNGIEAARKTGMAPIKINTVLLKGVNDGELDDFLDWIKREALSLRFIELMQTGSNRDYFERHHISMDNVRGRLKERGWRPQLHEDGAGPAVIFAHPDCQGTVGLIAPYAKDFCTSCNRLRVTARGELLLCLFGNSRHSLRDLLQCDDQIEALQGRIRSLLHMKPRAHELQNGHTGLTPHLASLGG